MGSTPTYRPVMAHHGWGEIADHLRELCSDWGDYYASRPRLMCGNVAEGVALLRDTAAQPAPCAAPVLCLAGAS